MSRIIMRKLLNLTEQAPQPAPQSPVPAPAIPNSEPPQTEPQDAGGESTTPDDPGEYDFTKDFRAFQDAKAKAENAAKKKLLDKMSKMLVGKKIVANASRGYGQPKTDYTLTKVKKVSVEFWYKDYVVIITDENDKKFFLTPNVNIKIESPTTEPTQEVPPTEEPQTDSGVEPASPGGQEPESPEGQEPESPEVPQVPNEPQGIEQPSQSPMTMKKPMVKPEAPAPSQEKPSAQPNVVPVDFKKKKKAQPQEQEPESMVAEQDGVEGDHSEIVLKTKVSPENVSRDVAEYFPTPPGHRGFDVRPYIKSALTSGQNEDGGYHTEYVLEIPRNVLGNNFDPKDFELEVRDGARHYGGPGQPFARGGVSIEPIGRNYVFTFSFSGGLDI